MSSEKNISDSMIFDRRLSISDIRIYAALVKCAAGGNQCTISKKQISSIAGNNKVERHTKNLHSYGYVKITQSESGKYNTYFLPLVVSTPIVSLSDRLSTFAVEYLKYSIGTHSPATTRTYRSCINEFISYVGDVSCKSIDVRLAEQFLAYKKLTVSGYTARKHYISLKSVFERAVQWNLISDNPFKRIKQPRVAEVEVAYFEHEDMSRLISSIDDQNFKNLVICGFYTSCRRGELLNLRWTDIDFEHRVIYLRNSEVFTTKSKKNRIIGINKSLFALMLRMKGATIHENDWVFKNSKGLQHNANTVSKTFKKYVLKAGLNPRLRFHSLRHTGTSLMLAMGTPSFVVQRHLGHQRLQTTEKYSHVHNNLLVKAADTLPALIQLN